MSIEDHAKREFELAAVDDALQKALLSYITGDNPSAPSDPFRLSMYRRLIKSLPLTPLTGEDSEWIHVGQDQWQNCRCSSVYREAFYDGPKITYGVYDVNAEINLVPSEDYTRWVPHKLVRTFITFPYTVPDEPKKTYYIDQSLTHTLGEVAAKEWLAITRAKHYAGYVPGSINVLRPWLDSGVVIPANSYLASMDVIGVIERMLRYAANFGMEYGLVHALCPDSTKSLSKTSLSDDRTNDNPFKVRKELMGVFASLLYPLHRPGTLVIYPIMTIEGKAKVLKAVPVMYPDKTLNYWEVSNDVHYQWVDRTQADAVLYLYKNQVVTDDPDRFLYRVRQRLGVPHLSRRV